MLTIHSKSWFCWFPQKLLNCPQKDCLRTGKLSILQCVLKIKLKITTNRITNYEGGLKSRWQGETQGSSKRNMLTPVFQRTPPVVFTNCAKLPVIMLKRPEATLQMPIFGWVRIFSNHSCIIYGTKFGFWQLADEAELL